MVVQADVEPVELSEAAELAEQQEHRPTLISRLHLLGTLRWLWLEMVDPVESVRHRMTPTALMGVQERILNLEPSWWWTVESEVAKETQTERPAEVRHQAVCRLELLAVLRPRQEEMELLEASVAIPRVAAVAAVAAESLLPIASITEVPVDQCRECFFLVLGTPVGALARVELEIRRTHRMAQMHLRVFGLVVQVAEVVDLEPLELARVGLVEWALVAEAVVPLRTVWCQARVVPVDPAWW